MAETSKAVITDIRELPMVNPSGQVMPGKLVFYRVDGTRNYSTWIPAERSDMASIVAQIQKEEQDRSKLMSQPIDIPKR